MQTYVVLMNVCERGVKSIKKAPERIEMNAQALKKAGGRLVCIYATMGQYDFIAVMEAPSDEVMMKHLLEVSATSAIKCTTLKAFSQKDFAKIAKSLS
jgi:uncharacterized protein with GYD domain